MKIKDKKWLLLLIPVLLGLMLLGTGFMEYYKSISENAAEEAQEGNGFDQPRGFYEFYHRISTPIGQTKNGYPINHAYHELQKAMLAERGRLKSAGSKLNWVQRGPGNVAGRTRTVIVDPDDSTHQTWFAAAVSGGIWKTTNGGNTWTNLTNNLPDLATNTMAMAPSNHNIIYAGTGEGYGGVGMVTGDGIFKSTDRGASWNLVGSTDSNEVFQFVNKIVIDHDDANVLLAATNNGIFKSIDGGASWDTVYNKGYEIQDLAVNPKNWKTVYATANGLGIIKSYNFGDTWFDDYNGIGTGYRFSVAVSPVDTNYVYTSVEAPNLKTNIYISTDGAANWRLMNDADNSFIDFLGNQGWFNNVIAAHPFDKHKVFVGGVYVGMLTFSNTNGVTSPQVIRVDTIGTNSFMQFINFGGDFLGGGMSTGLVEGANVTANDFVSVELRFGPGISQKAYRFTVPVGQGPGVPPQDYTYQDYVDVPFQAWDMDNNRQLMVSFRDQERDGKFNLIKRTVGNDINGREYIFIHSIPYSTTPDSSIAKDGGHFTKMLYFFWPTLPDNAVWDPNNLPTSKISVKYGTMTTQDASTTILADASRNNNLHVDHHAMDIVVTDSATQKFMILGGNDGGLGLSVDDGNTWQQIRNGYITTQFYGVAKKPGVNEYIGGMQDNGTWQSPLGEVASQTSQYDFRISGDGFDALWHPVYPHRILASSYNNLIKLSDDGGSTWTTVTSGIADGPFVTRLSNSNANPDLVFAVGSKGVYRNINFCMGRSTWQLVSINNGWAINGQVTSSHNVEVSLANPKVVWAGAGMYGNPLLHVFVSKDYGVTFDSVKNYTGREMGYLTGIATDPLRDSVAYLLFSIPHRPKILRTEDFGKTWEDISGFGQDSTSSNGFPDVMVYSLLVMPYNTNIIWAGTEIGIFESTDNGASWHYADNGLPAVSIWQMLIRDNTIVLATHGRGIWTTGAVITGIDHSPQLLQNVRVYPNPSTGPVTIAMNSGISGNLDVGVYNLEGKEVFNTSYWKSTGIFNNTIDLSGLAKGIYLIKVTHQDNSYTAKVILK